MPKMNSSKEFSGEENINDFINTSIRAYIKRINKFIDD